MTEREDKVKQDVNEKTKDNEGLDNSKEGIQHTDDPIQTETETIENSEQQLMSTIEKGFTGLAEQIKAQDERIKTLEKPKLVNQVQAPQNAGANLAELAAKYLPSILAGDASDKEWNTKDFFATIGFAEFKMFQKFMFRNMAQQMGMKFDAAKNKKRWIKHE